MKKNDVYEDECYNVLEWKEEKEEPLWHVLVDSIMFALLFVGVMFVLSSPLWLTAWINN